MATVREWSETVPVAMIGGGYVGLVSGACFAEFGVEVAVVETHPGRLQSLREGRIPIYEPGLDTLVAANIAAGRLSFGDDIREASPAPRRCSSPSARRRATATVMPT